MQYQAYHSPTLELKLDQTVSIEKEDPEERLTQMPASLGISHFGVLPRACYPLVVLLTLTEPDTRDTYNIVSMTPCVHERRWGSVPMPHALACALPFQVASVTVVHVPDEKYQLSERILFQYLLTVQGNMYELKVQRCALET